MMDIEEQPPEQEEKIELGEGPLGEHLQNKVINIKIIII